MCVSNKPADVYRERTLSVGGECLSAEHPCRAPGEMKTNCCHYVWRAVCVFMCVCMRECAYVCVCVCVVDRNEEEETDTSTVVSQRCFLKPSDTSFLFGEHSPLRRHPAGDT